jgi:hypothetical protein
MATKILKSAKPIEPKKPEKMYKEISRVYIEDGMSFQEIKDEIYNKIKKDKDCFGHMVDDSCITFHTDYDEINERICYYINYPIVKELSDKKYNIENNKYERQYKKYIKKLKQYEKDLEKYNKQ